ncbi:MAG: hypothetical protein ACNI3A_14965 [Desulfovibrio sp.]|uniref:hypothetical protein n=1 Tax=Desulfovibrio sp. 7SRBS1 TaxID=3378064 RepID=UPI003B3F2856
MEAIDYTVLMLYFCSLLAIALHANRKQKTTEDYYVGGRGAGTLSLAALWMSSWVGGAAIMGTAEKSYQIGIATSPIRTSSSSGTAPESASSAPSPPSWPTSATRPASS